jgi:DNA-directed RNA polymerase specialized sigma24 family protein
MTRDIYAIFNAFYQRHATKLFRGLAFGYWTLHPTRGRTPRPGVGVSLAEEICQQVWTEMWEHIVAGKELSAVLLYQRADARLTDSFRHVRRFRQLDDTHLCTPTGISRDETIEIHQFLDRLPFRDRGIVTDWLHGYTMHEIAERNEIHPNTAANIIRGTKQMNAQEQTTTTKKKTADRVIDALPGTPAEIAKRTGINRGTVKKQLQRLVTAGKVVNEAGTYSLALAPTDTTELIASLKTFLDKLARKEIEIVPCRFDDMAVAEHDMPTVEPSEMLTAEAPQMPSSDSSEIKWIAVNVSTAEPRWSRI